MTMPLNSWTPSRRLGRAWLIALIGLLLAGPTSRVNAQQAPPAKAPKKANPAVQPALKLLPALAENPKSAPGGLVVSVDRYASKVGADVLRQGGNAVDAAVATAFALAVTHPEAGNIGGGGFMVVRLPNGELFTVDFREKAPKAATVDMYLKPDGSIDFKKAGIGWAVVGVPGSVHGLWTAHQKAGKLPWKQLVTPAVTLARDGFVVDAYLAKELKQHTKDFQAAGEPGRVYIKPLQESKKKWVGQTLKLPDLANTLNLVAEKGPDGFYKGPVAQKIADAMKKNDGLITLEDLANYQAKIRKPLTVKFRDRYTLVGMPPPSSGGTVVGEMLQMIEAKNPSPSNKLPTRDDYHLWAQCMKRAFYDRARYLGDTDFVDVPLEKLLSPENAKKWVETMGPQATPSLKLGKNIVTAVEPTQTTHFSVMDAQGTMVSVTTTLEGEFGAKVIAPGTGVLLNNEMHDFNLKEGYTDTKGRIGTKPNLIAPHKRMLSSMSPSLILRENKPFLVIGSPGGRTIINTVFQVTLRVLDHGQPIQKAVDAPRLHHQWMPDEIVVEPKYPADIIKSLKDRGHTVVLRTSPQGDCHAIYIDPKTGAFHPGIDRRRRGSAYGLTTKPQ